jgi:hypothetical protein
LNILYLRCTILTASIKAPQWYADERIATQR